MKSKRKGYRGEIEFARLTNGKRVPLSGMMEGYKNDVILPNGWSVEVKRQKEGHKTLYHWLEQSKTEAFAFQSEEKPWMIAMRLDTFLQLLGKK